MAGRADYREFYLMIPVHVTCHLRKHGGFASLGWLVILGLFWLCLPARPCLGAPPPATLSSTPHRLVIVLETSRSMGRRTRGIVDSAKQLFDTSFDGQLRAGDRLEIWTLNENLYRSWLTITNWLPEYKLNNFVRVLSVIQGQRYEKYADFEKLSPDLNRALASPGFATVVLLVSGETPLQGTPFDAEINHAFDGWQEEQQKKRMPLVTLLRSVNGTVTTWSIAPAPWPVEVPPLPALLPALQPAPVAKANSTPPPPSRTSPPPITFPQPVRPIARTVVPKTNRTETLVANPSAPVSNHAASATAPPVPLTPAPFALPPTNPPQDTVVAAAPAVQPPPPPVQETPIRSNALVQAVALTKPPESKPAPVPTVPVSLPASANASGDLTPSPATPSPDPDPQPANTAEVSHAEKNPPSQAVPDNPPARPKPVPSSEAGPATPGPAPSPAFASPTTVDQVLSFQTPSLPPAPESPGFLLENLTWVILLVLFVVISIGCFGLWIRARLRPNVDLGSPIQFSPKNIPSCSTGSNPPPQKNH